MVVRKGDKNGITRRAFVVCGAASLVVLGVTLCLLGPSGCSKVIEIGKTPSVMTEAYNIEDGAVVVIDLDKVVELGKVGGSAKIVDARLYAPLIIAKVGEEEYVVASIRCPYCGSELEYYHDRGQFICCGAGSSAFDLDGNRVGGPAKKPIRIYRAYLDGKLLKVDKKK